MPTPGRDSLSDSNVRAILNTWKDLKPEHVELYVLSGVGRTLIDLKRSGFQCSTGDPLLVVCPDPSNYEASMAYLYGGNFALPSGTPGQRPWPDPGEQPNGTERAYLPAGVDAPPPFALGRFIKEQVTAAEDMTEGNGMNVFHHPNLGVYNEVFCVVHESKQFWRMGRLVSTRYLKKPEEPVLVRAFILERIDGTPRVNTVAPAHTSKGQRPVGIGGLGHIAIQFIRALGAVPLASSRSSKNEKVGGAKAEHVQFIVSANHLS